jgi:hypothetical protein
MQVARRWRTKFVALYIANATANAATSAEVTRGATIRFPAIEAGLDFAQCYINFI